MAARLEAELTVAGVDRDRAAVLARCREHTVDDHTNVGELSPRLVPRNDDDRRLDPLHLAEPLGAIGLETGRTRIARAHEQAIVRGAKLPLLLELLAGGVRVDALRLRRTVREREARRRRHDEEGSEARPSEPKGSQKHSGLGILVPSAPRVNGT